LHMVREAYCCVKIPIIGIGGIMNAEDAIAFFLCGASAIQIGTASFIDPKSAIYIIKGIKEYMQTQNMKGMKDLIGFLKI
jgi:dihydroorotate dehydrogenase (NAD+) catalytic subunit